MLQASLHTKRVKPGRIDYESWISPEVGGPLWLLAGVTMRGIQLLVSAVPSVVGARDRRHEF